VAIDWTALAQESPDAAEFEANVLAYFRRKVGFDAAFFSVKGLEAAPTVLGLEQATVKQAVAGGERYAKELLPVMRAALAARGVAVDTDVLGTDRVRRTRYFREVVASVGGKHSLMAYVPWRGRVFAGVILGRTGGTFSSRELGLVESALPGLGVARAAFGVPQASARLGEPAPPTLLERFGFEPRARVLASEQSERETLIVRDRAGFREMVASDARGELVWTRASLRDPSQSGWPYVDLFHLAATLATQRRRALFIGCGGAVALRQFARVYPGVTIDVVERDPAVVALARRWFALDAIPNTRVHIEDGGNFVARAAPGAWDVVIVDAYGASSLASPFAERRFFAALRRALDPGGSAAFNVIGTLAGRGPVRDVTRLACAEFSRVRLLPVVALEEAYAADSARNVVIVATGAK
jgi:spermidine synthase